MKTQLDFTVKALFENAAGRRKVFSFRVRAFDFTQAREYAEDQFPVGWTFVRWN